HEHEVPSFIGGDAPPAIELVLAGGHLSRILPLFESRDFLLIVGTHFPTKPVTDVERVRSHARLLTRPGTAVPRPPPRQTRAARAYPRRCNCRNGPRRRRGPARPSGPASRRDRASPGE